MLCQHDRRKKQANEMIRELKFRSQWHPEREFVHDYVTTFAVSIVFSLFITIFSDN